MDGERETEETELNRHFHTRGLIIEQVATMTDRISLSENSVTSKKLSHIRCCACVPFDRSTREIRNVVLLLIDNDDDDFFHAILVNQLMVR